jgi:replicative DNA helicase
LSEFDELETFWKKEFENESVGQVFTLDEVTDDLEEIIAGAYSVQGLRWRLDCLNKSLGSLRRGDFGFIFARPETGKTTFLASEITNFLGDVKQPIVWFNNEEQGSKVMLRIYQAYFGATLEQLLANPKDYKNEFLAQTQGNFRLFDSATISRRDVERIVTKLNPTLVIYDQIDKIKGFVNEREDLRLGSIYQWARELAKGGHAAIGVCQADGHAEGVRYLTMEHVSNAKTSKQAEADFILGIGKTNDDAAEYVRYLNISKNKLMGDKDTIAALRHGRFETIIQPEIARYADVIKFN